MSSSKHRRVSELSYVVRPLTGLEYIHIVQNGENRKIRVTTFAQQIAIFIQQSLGVNYIQTHYPTDAPVGSTWLNPEQGTVSVMHDDPNP